MVLSGLSLKGASGNARFRGVMGFLAFLAVWEVLPVVGLLPARYFPPFHEVLVTMAGNLASLAFWQSVLYTTEAWFLGLTIAFVAATLVTGESMPVSKKIERRGDRRCPEPARRFYHTRAIQRRADRVAGRFVAMTLS